MGLFLNMGNDNFAEFSKTKYFVDKSSLINKLLQKDITEKFICNSKARRFGKSVTADMLVAYFSKGADSRELFAPLACVKDTLFVESMNDMTQFLWTYRHSLRKRQMPEQSQISTFAAIFSVS